MKFDYLCPLIQVFDMKVSLQFYVDVLGFQIHQQAGEAHDIGWVWLRRDDISLMLNTLYELSDRPAQPDPRRMDAHHDTILYIGCEDIEAIYQHLVNKSIQCQPPETAPYGMKQLYLKDPDGYGICFQWPING